MGITLKRLSEEAGLICPPTMEAHRIGAASLFSTENCGQSNILYICTPEDSARAAELCPAVLCTEKQPGINILFPPRKRTPEELLEACCRILNVQDYIDVSISELNRAMFSNRGITYITEAASRIFRQPLLIADRSFKLIAGAGYNQINDPFLERIIREGYYPEDYIRNIAEHPEINDLDSYSDDRRVISEPFSPQRYMSRHINVRGKRIAFVTLVENTPFREGDAEIFAHFCKMIAAEMRSTLFEQDRKGSAYEVVLEELLNGELYGQRLYSRLKQVGLDFGQRKRLFVLRSSDRSTKQFHYEYLNNSFNMRVKNCHSVIYEQAIVGIADQNEDGKVFAEEGNELTAFLEHYEMVCGISNTVTDVLRIGDFRDQALGALNLGQKLNVGGPVYYHESLSVYHMLDKLIASCHLEDFCAPEYLRICDYDKINGTEYAATLEAYLDAAQNSLRTAERLGVHRNTVDYRVHRMEELFDFHFDDADMVFSVGLTMRILKYLALGNENTFVE